METSEVLILCAGIAAVLLGIVFILYRRRARRSAGAVAGADPWGSLRTTLGPGRQTFLERIKGAWGTSGPIEARLAGLEEVLITADVGVNVTRRLIDKVRNSASELGDEDRLRAILSGEMHAML